MAVSFIKTNYVSNFSDNQLCAIHDFQCENQYDARIMKSGNVAIKNIRTFSDNPHELIIGYNPEIGYFLRSRKYFKTPYPWQNPNGSYDFPYHYNRESYKYGFETFEEMMEYLKDRVNRNMIKFLIRK